MRCSGSIAAYSINIGHGPKTGSRMLLILALCPHRWTCRTGITEFNARSIVNFPIQATSADILRLVCIWVRRRGIELCAPVHDAVLVEAPIDQIEAVVALTREIMRRASRVVLGGQNELRTDVTIVRYPDRYSDKRGEQIWADVLKLLEQYQQQQGAEENVRQKGQR